MIDVLLVIDNRHRELTANLLIQHYLEEKGLKVKLCSRFNMIAAFNKYQPLAIVLPNALFTQCEALSSRCFVFVLPSESGNGQKDQIIAIMKGTSKSRCYNEYVDLCFSWGQAMTDLLIEHNVYSSDRLATTGHPATDHWLLPLKKEKTNTFGLSTTFRLLSNSRGMAQDMMRTIYRIEQGGGDGTYYLPPEHAESWIHWEAGFIRVICNIIDKISIKHNIKMEIRPHPIEGEKSYDYLKDVSKGNLVIRKEGSISEWFEHIDVLVTFLSASAIDAVVKGVPVISLKKILNQDALNRIPQCFHYDYYDYLWEPDNLEELRKFIEDAFEGNLPIAPQKNSLNEYILQNFHYPRKKSSASMVADKIYEHLKNNDKRNFTPIIEEKSALSKLSTKYVKLPFIVDGLIGAHYLKDIFDSKGSRGGIRTAYLPWNTVEINKAKKIVQEIAEYSEKINTEKPQNSLV